jgi:hypothetical protein
LKIREIEALTVNPFWLSKLLESFVDGYGNNTPFELTHLLFPFVLREKPRKELCKLNRNSTVYSAFLDHKDKRIRIFALQHYVSEYKKHVNPALIAYANNGNSFGIKLQNNRQCNYQNESDSFVKEYLKSAHILGSILSKEKTADCFFKLGVFQI